MCMMPDMFCDEYDDLKTEKGGLIRTASKLEGYKMMIYYRFDGD